MLIIYQVIFVGAALSALFVDRAGEIFLFLGIIGQTVRGAVPSFLISTLPVLGVVGGLVFTVVIHPALNAYTEIRMYYA